LVTAALGSSALVTAKAATITLRQLSNGGTHTLIASPNGSGALQSPEFPIHGPIGDELGSLAGTPDPATGLSFPAVPTASRSFRSRGAAAPVSVGASAESRDSATLKLGFDGLNLRNQRLANGGNQFTVEPPDQALCVGNGYVVEAVNDVTRVFDKAGNPLTGVVDLNTFFGYPAAIKRTPPRAFGPDITDPVCFFDHSTGHFFLAVLTLDIDPATDALVGSTHLDIAVSTTANPLDPWTVYSLPVTDDGSQGTPKHQDCPCLGDYPHIGFDANGVYLTTNEFHLFTPGFNGAQVYAVSKRALIAGASSPTVVQFDLSSDLLDGFPPFAIMRAKVPGNRFVRDNGGTELLVAAFQNLAGATLDNRLLVYALTNTKSLNGSTPALGLSKTVIAGQTFADPPYSTQKAGDFPLGECINDTTLPTPFGPGCWQNMFVTQPPAEVLSPVATNDSRMHDVWYADGKLYAALTTGVNVAGATQAGVAYWILETEIRQGQLSARIDNEGIVALPANDLFFPAIGPLDNGKAAIGFTVNGADHYPSAGYVVLNDGRAGNVHVTAEGKGPQDGFTGYDAYTGGPNGPNPRWGDYGAAAPDGDSIWLAAEYIGQTCTLAEYTTAPFGSCGGTRVTLGNWDTHIARIVP
jgi:hypothetical protein